MLFDLRSKGRRRVVKVAYSAIALIFLAGFLGAGVGTGFFGGANIFEAVGSGGGAKSFASQVERASKRVKREPASAAAWAALLQAQLHQAGESQYTNQSTGGFTPAGHKLLPKIQRTWENYLSVSHDNPSLELSKLMLHVLGEEGLDNAAQTVQALLAITEAEPHNYQEFAELAQYAYQAGNTREGDLASEKALALAPATERARLKGILNALKKNGGHLGASSSGEPEAG